jgi:hypothetical protein
MLGDSGYAFGVKWMQRQITQIRDLWDPPRHDWKSIRDLATCMGLRGFADNRARVIAAIPGDWYLHKPISPFAEFEWVARALLGPPNSNLIFQIVKLPNLGQAFIETKPTFFVRCPGPPTYLVINDLQRIRVVASTGDLRTTVANPAIRQVNPVWSLGPVAELAFNPCEWTWGKISPLEELNFLNYSTCMGYRIGLAEKLQLSRLRIKQTQLGLYEEETSQSIKLIWDQNKPAKFQHFLWQINSGGLPSGSWSARMGFPDECRFCAVGITESPEHCLRSCQVAMCLWMRTSNIRVKLGVPSSLSWRETLTSIPPGKWSFTGDYRQSSRPCNLAWDVFRSALLWQLWCARNRVVFQRDQTNVIGICHLAWKDTITAGMARRNSIMNFFDKCSEARHDTIALDFALTWCHNDIFCSGSLLCPKWRMLPCLTDHLPAQSWDPD